MLRSLSQDWLLAIRKDSVFSPATPDTLARLKAKRVAAAEVASTAQLREVDAGITYYEALAKYRMGQFPEATAALKATSVALGAGSPARRPATLAEALADGTAPGGSRPAPSVKVSEEESFLKIFSMLVNQDK